jgi:hypothetical protein
MSTMSKKERYFQTTKPKKYTDLITKEFKQLEVGSIVTLSFINNDLKIKPSSSVLLKMMYGFKELKNYEVLQTIKAPQSFVGDEVINVKPGTILATLVSPGGLQVVEDEVQISDEGTEQTQLVSSEDNAPTPEEIEEVQTRKQILSIKPTDKKNKKYLQFADTPMYPSEFVEQIGQEKYDEFMKNGKITAVSFS